MLIAISVLASLYSNGLELLILPGGFFAAQVMIKESFDHLGWLGPESAAMTSAMNEYHHWQGIRCVLLGQNKIQHLSRIVRSRIGKVLEKPN